MKGRGNLFVQIHKRGVLGPNSSLMKFVSRLCGEVLDRLLYVSETPVATSQEKAYVSMGNLDNGHQDTFGMETRALPEVPGHAFYGRLNGVLAYHEFKRFIEERYARFYAEKMAPPNWAVALRVDEESQLETLARRTQPLLPISPGYPERRAHDYVRNGTTFLFTALGVATPGLLSGFTLS
jgi:hypothetical protein